MEPTVSFAENHKVVMASCVVDVSKQQNLRVRVMNPGTEEVSVRKDVVIAEIEPVESITCVVEQEN